MKKKSTSRWFGEKNFEKKIRSQYHNASEISPVTYIRTYRLFLKTGFLAYWGLKTCLYAKKSKIKISPKTMVPLWTKTVIFFSLLDVVPNPDYHVKISRIISIKSWSSPSINKKKFYNQINQIFFFECSSWKKSWGTFFFSIR